MAIKGSIHWWLPRFTSSPDLSPEFRTHIPNCPLYTCQNSWLPTPNILRVIPISMITLSLQAITLKSSLTLFFFPHSLHPTQELTILPLPSKYTDFDHVSELHHHLLGPRHHLSPRLWQKPPNWHPLFHLCLTTVYSLNSQNVLFKILDLVMHWFQILQWLPFILWKKGEIFHNSSQGLSDLSLYYSQTSPPRHPYCSVCSSHTSPFSVLQKLQTSFPLGVFYLLFPLAGTLSIKYLHGSLPQNVWEIYISCKIRILK